MINRLKSLLKKIGLFKYYMSLKRIFYLNKKERKIEEQNKEKRIGFYKEIIKSGNLCFDVGANIGNRTEVFLELGATVIAIEPQEECALLLKNKFNGDIIIEKVGLGQTEGEMEMFIADESTISTFSSEFIEKTKDSKFKNNSWGRKVMIPITTLDKLINKYGIPDFCKIDVEGFEPMVLEGLSKLIPKVSFEYNVPELSKNIHLCLDLLNKIFPDYKYNFCVGESMNFELSKWQTYTEFKRTVSSEMFLSTDFGDIYAFIK